MKIWWMDTYPGYMRLQFTNQDDFRKYTWNYFMGESLEESWEPQVMKDEGNGRASDCPGGCRGALYVSERVVQAVKELHVEHVEFLPITYSGTTYYIMNVLNVIDCIDGADSRLNDHVVPDYTDITFIRDAVADQHLFKAYSPGTRKVYNNRIFVSDALKNRIEQLNLVGFQFVEEWDSEFSWQEKETKYEAMVEEVDRSLIQTFDYKKAVYLVEKERMTVYSGKHAMKLDEKGRLASGTLLLDGTYDWFLPLYIPPIYLGLKWGIREERKSFLERLKERIAFR